MTNKKFTSKGRRQQERFDIAQEIAVEIFKIMCVFLLTLNKNYPKIFYPKKCDEWLEKLAANLEQGNDWEEDGIFDEKMSQLCREYLVSEDKCCRIVRRFSHKFNDAAEKLMVENVKIMFIQTADDYGFGKVRLERLAEQLLKCELPADPVKTAQERLGISLVQSEVGFDMDKLYPKKKQVGYGEAVRVRKQLEEYKCYFDSEVKKSSA